MGCFSPQSKKQTLVKGFSIIEMMIYMALLIVISVSAVYSLISFSDTVQAYRANQLVARSAMPLLERFEVDVRSATMVNQLSSSFGVSPGNLTVVSGPTSTAYALTGEAVTVTEDGETQVLTDAAVTVDDLTFHFYDNVSTELVRMEVTLTATVGATTRTQTFNTATVLRGSYE